MAKSSKRKRISSKATVSESDSVAPVEQAEDAVTLIEEAMTEEARTEAATDVDEQVQPPEDDEEASETEADQAEPEEPAAEVTEEPTATNEPEPAAETSAPAEIQDPAPQKSGAGFFPLLLGGVAAGAIGYGIGQYDPTGSASFDFNALMSEQATRIDALDDQVSNLGDVPDMNAITAQIEEAEAGLASRFDDLDAGLRTAIEGFEARLTELEKRPNADGTLSDTALSAYQAELEGLRAELEAQKEDVTSLAAQAQADLEAARAEAAEIEQQAIATAEAAAARAAINRVAAAAETGAPFAAALADPSLAGVEIPAALTEVAEDGLPTSAQLATAFPDAARAALAAARSEGQSDDAGGLGGFLRNQFDVRSTTPQEGSGPDAVLSRAEAAIKDGRVADALAEIEALPEVARAAMTDWTGQAQSRSEALAAIATMSETLNSN